MKRNKLAPYISSGETVTYIRLDLLFALIPLIVISVVQNGLRVLVMCVLAAAASAVTELLSHLVGKKRNDIMRAATLGLCLTLLCPVTVPVWLPAAGSAFAVLFVRVILVGDFRTLFMHPAIGWLFMLTVWPSYMMTYPKASGFNAFPIFADVKGFESSWSIARCLQFGIKPETRMLDVLFGRYPGGLGTTCIFAILAITVFFLIRKSIAWQVSLSMMATVSVFALFVNRAGVSPLYSVVYELCAANLIYVAIFIAGDLVNAPKLPVARVLFGILIGVFTMLLRYFGMFEHCVVIALIFANLFSGGMDRIAVAIRGKRAKRFDMYG
ncbi:MAG: RnfABCDGE type electron transport complex subunit D [Oscillospiraceae bacterium]|nr:RnfABCDGE type electron transport complex subunit D [Candidatus Equicaccousia limihippi]